MSSHYEDGNIESIEIYTYSGEVLYRVVGIMRYPTPPHL